MGLFGGNKCEACGMSFKSKEELMEHNSKAHSSNMCSACGMSFKSARELKDHAAKSHKM